MLPILRSAVFSWPPDPRSEIVGSPDPPNTGAVALDGRQDRFTSLFRGVGCDAFQPSGRLVDRQQLNGPERSHDQSLEQIERLGRAVEERVSVARGCAGHLGQQVPK